MSIALLFFWISLSLLFYCYLGYAILMFLFNNVRYLFSPEAPKKPGYQLPEVTLVVTAYNEEKILEQKIKNTLELNYPASKLNIIFVTDGSSDNSVQMIRQYPAITLLHQEERRGKFAAVKRAMQKIQTPIVVFSDANSMLNKESIERMVCHYQDQKVGGVAGEKKILIDHHVSALGEAEGLYWKYESFMKKVDADFNTVVGAAGELFSIRTALFKELNDELILDDFVISMQVCLQGYKISYEPGAFAAELPSASLADEEKRKVRISAGAYQSIGYLKNCLNIFKYPLLSFQYISRRLLRWIFCPLMLIILFLTNIFILIQQPGQDLYLWFMYGQSVFYLLAIMGWMFVRVGRKLGWLAIPFYFVFMNYCLVKGFLRYLKGRQSVLWEKSLRQAVE